MGLGVCTVSIMQLRQNIYATEKNENKKTQFTWLRLFTVPAVHCECFCRSLCAHISSFLVLLCRCSGPMGVLAAQDLLAS